MNDAGAWSVTFVLLVGIFKYQGKSAWLEEKNFDSYKSLVYQVQ